MTKKSLKKGSTILLIVFTAALLGIVGCQLPLDNAESVTAVQQSPIELLQAAGTPYVICYTGANYTGAGRIYTKADGYLDSTKLGITFNDNISSIEVFNGAAIECWKNNFSGNETRIASNVPDFSVATWGSWDNAISSIKVYEHRAPHANFYRHANYGGDRIIVDGSVNSMPAGWNDQLSSVTVDPGICIVLFQHANYQGNYMYVAGTNEPNLVPLGFNDITSSFYCFGSFIH